MARLRPKYSQVDGEIEKSESGLILKISGNPSANLLGKGWVVSSIEFKFPSEHLLDGIKYDGEIQIVHIDEKSNDSLILSVFIENGVLNEQVGDFLRFVPNFGKKSSVRINPTVFLPSRYRYFEYRGSYSRPPCTEGVKWILLRDTVQYSMRQLEQLSRGVDGMVRKIQPRNQRRILTNQR